MCSCADEFLLQEGDLLFQDLDSSPLCEAIESVTPGYMGANLSHVGILVLINDTLKVLEATPPAIKLTDINSFLNSSLDNEGNPKVIVGRLKEIHQKSIEKAKKFLIGKLDFKYDEEFLLNNEKYYCSELIYEAFKKDSIFKLYPMKFYNDENNQILKIWKEYYTKINMKIPHNEPGINPGIMSLSKNIEIIYSYGNPNGMEK
mgnify:FL=1